MIPLFIVDAFTTTKPFSGNPAAVCALEDWPDDATLQNIATENNLAETAFFCETDLEGVYDIRWFTPEAEVDLCGHATLATAYVIMNELEEGLNTVTFQTQKAGVLSVTQQGPVLTLNFPARTGEQTPCPPEVLAALGVNTKPVACFKTHRDLYVVFDQEDTVKNASPNMPVLKATTFPWVCITASSSTPKTDFVSRFFTSDSTVQEDPVTGSTHCSLVPYWAEKLGKTEMKAKQLSKRGGELTLKLQNDRVFIAGQAKTYLRGIIDV